MEIIEFNDWQMFEIKPNDNNIKRIKQTSSYKHEKCATHCTKNGKGIISNLDKSKKRKRRTK